MKISNFTDIYFTRAKEILEYYEFNPWVNYQVFLRTPIPRFSGLLATAGFVQFHSDIVDRGGRIYIQEEQSDYNATNTVMNIMAPIQSIIELETVYLGILSECARLCVPDDTPPPGLVGNNMKRIVELAGERPVIFMGARHYAYDYDNRLGLLAKNAGISMVTTVNSGNITGLPVVGTIPHSLENIFAYYYGRKNAVVESTIAFDKVIPSDINRVALIDYNNCEIDDALRIADSLKSCSRFGGDPLWGVRIDTCGENIAQGGSLHHGKSYWGGTGVTVSAVKALRKALDDNGHKDVRIILSSGFSNIEKLKAFNEAEEALGLKLYDAVGAGFPRGPVATADIVAVGSSLKEVDYYEGELKQSNIIHKVGRGPKPNPKVKRFL